MVSNLSYTSNAWHIEMFIRYLRKEKERKRKKKDSISPHSCLYTWTETLDLEEARRVLRGHELQPLLWIIKGDKKSDVKNIRVELKRLEFEHYLDDLKRQELEYII